MSCISKLLIGIVFSLPIYPVMMWKHSSFPPVKSHYLFLLHSLCVLNSNHPGGLI